MSKFFMLDGEMQKLLYQDQDAYIVKSWIIFNTNYQDQYKDLKKFELYFSYRSIADNLNISTSKVQKVIKKLLEHQEIEYIFKSNSRTKPSIIKANFIANNPIYQYDSDTVNDTVSDTVSDTVKPIDNTIIKHVDNTKCNTVSDTVSDTLSKYNNLNNNLNELSIIIVNSDQLELIQNRCSITGKITKEQQTQIKEMDISLLQKAINQCNKFKASYNINYLLTVYKSLQGLTEGEKAIKKDNNTKRKYDPIENPHYKKYDDLEERLLKMQGKLHTY